MKGSSLRSSKRPTDLPRLFVDLLEHRLLADLAAAPPEVVGDRLLRLSLAKKPPDRFGQIVRSARPDKLAALSVITVQPKLARFFR